MDGILKPLKTLEDWNEAMDAARFDCNHSMAQIAPSKSKIRASRKMAFLSAFPTVVKSQQANCEVKRTGSQPKKHVSRSGPSTDQKIQIFVRSSVAKTISLRLLASTSICNLKGILQEKSGIPLEKQYLYTMKGLLLCDALSLEDHGLECDANLELQLVPGLMGGCRKRRPKSGGQKKAEPTPPRQGEKVHGGQSEMSPRQEEPPSGAASADSVNCQSEPTAQEDTPSGASSAESVPQSSPSPPASKYHQQPVFNLNFNKSVCTIGPSSGNTYNFGIPITADVQRHGEIDKALTDHLLDMLQALFNDYKVMIGLRNFLRTVSAQLADIVPGSVKLIAQVTSREGLDKLWAMYQSGELAKRLTEILITDELMESETKNDITLKVTMMESDYRKGCEWFESIEEKLPERMADWTAGQVKHWLLDIIRVKKHSVEQLYHEGFDGRALLSYTRDQLMEDFNLDKIGSRLISNGKEDWLKSVNRQPEKYIEVTKVDRDESGQKGKGLPLQTTDVTIRATDGTSKDETDTQRDKPNKKTHSMHSESTQVFNPPSTTHPQTPKFKDKHIEPSSKHSESSSVTKQVDAGKTCPTTKPVGHCKPTSLDEAEKKSQPSVRPKQRVTPLKQKQQPISSDRKSTTPINPSLQHPTTSQDELALEEGHSAQTPSSIPVQSDCKTTEISPEVLKRSKETASSSTSDKETDVKKQIGQIHDESGAEGSSAAIVSLIEASKTSTSKDVAPVVPFSKQKMPPHRPMRLQSKESHAEEPRLRKLLTGDEHGELDKSFYPVLIVNKPPESVMPSEKTDLEQASIAQQFGFINGIKWVTVLDFNSKSLVNGLCKLYHDERMVTLQQPELFKDVESDVELTSRIEFPEKTLWIFTNGREDDPSLATPRMNLQDWNRERSRDVEACITFFSKPSVIPKGRAVLLFLILSDDEIDIICDTFRKISSSFQGLQNITCIAEDPKSYAKFVSGVSRWFSEEEINQISVVGLTWEDMNRIMMRMEGIHQTMDHELPCPGGRPSCFLSDKQREEWNDITVIYKNECENTDMDESNPGYEKFAQRKELSFYHGEKVDWWNFALGDKLIGGGCGHVLKRKGFGELLQKMIKPLNSRKFNDSKIVTVTLLHEPGAGGSTLARHVFWGLHREHRCIVINKVTNSTVNQVMEVRRYGYENRDAEEIPPICVLVENLDDMELTDLIAELEEVSKGIDVGHGAVCVLLHCKRSVMSFKITQDKSSLEVALYHKLDPSEKAWFQRKYTELEDKEKMLQTGEFKPDNLLAFMVMKEEFNTDYIKNVVSRILLDVKNDELLLIKYCAFLNSYRPDSVIPISCCDSMMGKNSPLMRLGGRSHHISSPRQPWEKMVSPSFNIMVLRQNNGIKIFHKNIAEEVLGQIMQQNGNQSRFDVTVEFLKSELLKSKSYSLQNLFKTTHDLLIRRTKLSNEAKTDFSDLIEAIILSHKSQAAIDILKLGFEILDDPFVAQQVARLYLKESEFGKASTYADKALNLDLKNAYFWDTKGRILKKYLTKLSQPFLDEHQVMEDGLCRDFTSKSFEAMKVFRNSYEVSKEKMQTEYTGLYAVVDVAFRLLKVIYTCVEPLRTHGGKTQHSKPDLSPELESTLDKLKNRIEYVLNLMDDITTYYKDGSHAQVAKRTLDEVKEYLRKYTSLYEKYFADSLSGNYRYPVPTNVLDERRFKVKQLKCDQFRDIFDLARAKNDNTLLQALQLLGQNSSDYSFFDLKTQILVHLALSSMGKPIMKADDVYQKFVRPLFKERDRDGNFYPPFFMMMFLWPLEGVESERKDRNDLSYYSFELTKRGDNEGQERVKRHAKYNMKPRTYFFLGQGKDLRVFVHISELPHAAQHKLDKHDKDGTFWHSDFVRKRLLRLKGVLISPMYLVYRSPKGEDIQIKLAVPYTKRTPSQEKVEFYLGFSWVGPVAYDVTTKNKRHEHEDTVLRFHEAYPKHILSDQSSRRSGKSDSLGISKLERKRQDLHMELQTLDKQGIKTEETKRKREEILRNLTKTQADLNEALVKLEDSFEDDAF
ncbi:sterile alpha motif domain-containing protein 9-like [Asterias amurensis]|uniref:sterile alpha motif domain-containing protein 9-like n=1 Tax=Asterias amurensis TaxID=7602 RepID=UPI003AB7BEC4